MQSVIEACQPVIKQMPRGGKSGRTRTSALQVRLETVINISCSGHPRP
jgi:hypothetical protein